MRISPVQLSTPQSLQKLSPLNALKISPLKSIWSSLMRELIDSRSTGAQTSICPLSTSSSPRHHEANGSWHGRVGSSRPSVGSRLTLVASSTLSLRACSSASYCSFSLSISWSWLETSSFKAPFKAVSSRSRFLKTSSCSSLAMSRS